MNDKIKNFWKSIDKELNKFNGKFKYDIKQRIMRVLRTFNITRDNLYSYMNTNDMSIFKSELQDNENKEMSDYLKYKIDKMLQRVKIKYWEALQLLIEIEYFKVMNNAKKFEDELFTATVEITSNFYQEESYRIRPRLRKYHYIPIPLYLLPHIMSTPLYLGYNWLEYKQSIIDYNANKTYRKVVVGIAQNNFDINTYDKSFQIERKRYLTALDNEVASVSSYVALWGMKEQGIKKVQYVAVMDDRTTKICQSMHGQIFKVNDWNTYYRYANENDERTTKYVTNGLQIGENQPALHYNCRSVLYPYK